MPSVSFTDPIEVVLLNTTEWIDFTFLDDLGLPLEAQSVDLTIYDSGQAVYLTESYPSLSTRIVHPSTGYYYFTFGDVVPPPGTTNPENGATGIFYFQWHVVPFSGEPVNAPVQTVAVISPKTSGLLQQFKDYVDKSRKYVDSNTFLGYTEPQLLSYLAGGLSLINAYQPGIIFDRFDTFPDVHAQVLLDAALSVAIRSQELYAIDTDISSYSDQGNVFVLEHFPKLAAFLAALEARLDKIVPMMKLQYVMTGSLHIEAGPSFRLSLLLATGPTGALFRSWFTNI